MGRFSGKLVVADDEPMLRNLVGASLKGQGFEVLTAANGEQAFELVKANPEVILVISDINMPGKDGWWLVNALNESEFSALPVILMTGEMNQFDKVKAKGASVIAKPFRREELVQMISFILKGELAPS